MSQITIVLTPELEERVGLWQRETSGDTTVLITEALEEYLEGWEGCTDAVELALDEADIRAEGSPVRLTHEEVFAGLRKRISDGQSL